MRVICSTSNSYKHLIPVFVYLFNKNWSADQEVEIVGYDKPDFELPPNFSFYSMGEQIGGPENFSTDLRKYFEQQSEEAFIWCMEDNFIKGVNFEELEKIKRLIHIPNCVKINLSTATLIQTHTVYGDIEGLKILENTKTSKYRLSMQPSIWKKDYLLKYMTPGLTPWKMEVLPAQDDFRIFGSDHQIIRQNEGVTKHDIYKLNLNGVLPEQIEEMKKLNILP